MSGKIITPKPSDVFSLLDSREKDYPGLSPDQFSYKLSPNGFGLDAPIENLDVDLNAMSMYLPVASGVRRDGVGDLVRIDGIRTERHFKNPVILANHGKEVPWPIARAREDPKDPDSYTFKLDVLNKKAGARIFFWGNKDHCNAMGGCDNYQHAKFCQECFHMAANGFLNAGSIGYSIIKANQLEPDYRTGLPQGLDLHEILMLEASLVIIPASIDTVGKALTGGKIDGSYPSEYFTKAFSSYLPPRKHQEVSGFQSKTLDTITKDYSQRVPNYRRAEDPEQSCQTCGAFIPHGNQFGQCNMFNTVVGPEDTCDRWFSREGEKSLNIHTKAIKGPLRDIERDDDNERWLVINPKTGRVRAFMDKTFGGPADDSLRAAMTFRDGGTEPSDEEVQSALREYRREFIEEEYDPTDSLEPGGERGPEEEDLFLAPGESHRDRPDLPEELPPGADFYGPARPASRADPFPPGSEGSLRERQRRLEHAEELFHPEDVQHFGDADPPIVGETPEEEGKVRVHREPRVPRKLSISRSDPSEREYTGDYEGTSGPGAVSPTVFAGQPSKPKKKKPEEVHSGYTPDPNEPPERAAHRERIFREKYGKKPPQPKQPKEAPKESPPPESKSMHGPQCKCAECIKKYGNKSCGCSNCSKGHACPCGNKNLPNEQTKDESMPPAPSAPSSQSSQQGTASSGKQSSSQSKPTPPKQGSSTQSTETQGRSSPQAQTNPTPAPTAISVPENVHPNYLSLPPSQAAKKATDKAIAEGKNRQEVEKIGQEVFDFVHQYSTNFNHVLQREIRRALNSGMSEDEAIAYGKERTRELLGKSLYSQQKHIRHESSRKSGHQWVLYNHDMSKVLGTHPSKEAAENQERAVEAHKHFSPNEYMWNSKSLKDLIQKYRQPTGKFFRSKKAVPGVIHMHIKTDDLDNLRKAAGAKGAEAHWLSDDGKGTSKLKLVGMDGVLEDLAKQYAKAVKKMKSLPNQQNKSTNVIGTIEPDDKTVRGDPAASRERASLGNVGDSLLNSEGGTEENGRPEHTGVLTARGTKAMNKKVTIETKDEHGDLQPNPPGSKHRQEDGGVQGEGQGEKTPGEDYTPSDQERSLEAGEDYHTKGPSGPYGAQVVRRLHADMAGLLHEYDEFLDNLEDESTRQLVLKQIQHFINSLEELEEHASTHERYKDLFHKEPLEGVEGKQFEEESSSGVPFDSELGAETTPEEALEGMSSQEVPPEDGLSPEEEDEAEAYHKHVKSLRTKHKQYPEMEKEKERYEEHAHRKPSDEKAYFLRLHLKNLGNKVDPESKKLRSMLIKQLKAYEEDKQKETLLQGQDKEHMPGHEACEGSEMDVTPGKKGKKAQPSDTADVSPEKARKILKDGEANGKPLTEKQRGFFGALAGKDKN